MGGEMKLTKAQREVIEAHGPYVLREDGCLVDGQGVALVQMVPYGGERCEWDDAVVAALNAIHDAAGRAALAAAEAEDATKDSRGEKKGGG